MLRIIDVSENNGAIDWAQVRPHIDGAIIRVGYRGYGRAGTLVKDTMCRSYLLNAAEQGIPVGAYFCSQAINDEEAYEEAVFIRNGLQGHRLALPVFLDSEWGEHLTGTGRADRISQARRTQYALTLLRTLRGFGYQTGLYTGVSWFQTELDGEAIRADGHKIWLASVEHVEPAIPYDAWQYSWLGHIPGIVTNVDMNHFRKSVFMEDEAMRYQRLNDIPNNNGFRDIIAQLMDAKIINGDGSDPVGNNDIIDLSRDQVRLLVFLYRGGAFDAKLRAMGLRPVVG